MRKPTQSERVWFLWQLLRVDEQVANADPHLRDEDLSELGISPEQAARFDLLAIKQDTIAREDAAWLDAEQRS